MKKDGSIEGDLSCGRDGGGASGAGMLRYENGEIYVDEVRLVDHLRQFLGKFCEFGFFFPAEAPDIYKACDEKIAPLVEALNAYGIRTFSSCEGHMEEHLNMTIRRPFVWVYLDDFEASKLQTPEGWEISRTDVSSEEVPAGATLGSFQTKQIATNEDELAELQRKAIELAGQIRLLARS